MTSTKQQLEFKLSIPSKTEYLGLVSNLINQAVKHSGGNSQSCFDVALAVDEMITNIIQHAYGGKPDGKIDISFKGSRNAIEISTLHGGKQIAPEKIVLPDLRKHLDAKKTRGLGLAIIMKLMDQVLYSTRGDNRAECRMVKHLRGSKSRSKKTGVRNKVAGGKT
ncbi:ATP-binding protein [Acidobacteriota bacterium]